LAKGGPVYLALPLSSGKRNLAEVNNSLLLDLEKQSPEKRNLVESYVMFVLGPVRLKDVASCHHLS
jgi:hypothetical protein